LAASGLSPRSSCWPSVAALAIRIVKLVPL
jgi:hypothetical protein